MKTTLRTLAAIFAVAGTLIVAPALMVSAAPKVTPTVLSNCGAAVSLPSAITISCADAHRYISGITWTNWGKIIATGTGTLNWNTCTPSCAAGTFEQKKIVFHAKARYQGTKLNYYRVLIGPRGAWGQKSTTWVLPSFTVTPPPTTTLPTTTTLP